MTPAVPDSQRQGRLARPLIWGPLVDTGTSQETRLHLPAGTVTFLLTDIEGSTRLWEADFDAMSTAVARSYAMLEDAVGRHVGVRPVEGSCTCQHVPSSPQKQRAAASARPPRRKRPLLGSRYMPSGRCMVALTSVAWGRGRVWETFDVG
jgi:class 3 adenylate cyclase